MPGLGRIPAPDARDDNFPMRAAHGLLGVDDRPVPSLVRHRTGPILDQGETGTCVAHAWEGTYLGRPMARRADPDLTPFDAYRRIVQVDEWDDNDFESFLPDDKLSYGTSVRAGAKFYQAIGRIDGDYVWGRSLEDGVRHVGLVAPVVLGINWYDTFWDPDREGIIRLTPRSRIVGGHAIKWVGIDLGRGLAELQNSWGLGWGGWFVRGRRYHAGLCRVPLEDVDRLAIREDGEMCAAVKVRRTR